MQGSGAESVLRSLKACLLDRPVAEVRSFLLCIAKVESRLLHLDSFGLPRIGARCRPGVPINPNPIPTWINNLLAARDCRNLSSEDDVRILSVSMADVSQPNHPGMNERRIPPRWYACSRSRMHAIMPRPRLPCDEWDATRISPDWSGTANCVLESRGAVICRGSRRKTLKEGINMIELSFQLGFAVRGQNS